MTKEEAIRVALLDVSHRASNPVGFNEGILALLEALDKAGAFAPSWDAPGRAVYLGWRDALDRLATALGMPVGSSITDSVDVAIERLKAPTITKAQAIDIYVSGKYEERSFEEAWDKATRKA